MGSTVVIIMARARERMCCENDRKYELSRPDIRERNGSERGNEPKLFLFYAFWLFFAALLCEAITAMRNLIWCSKVEPAIRPFMMNNFAAVRVTRCRAAARRQREC